MRGIPTVILALSLAPAGALAAGGQASGTIDGRTLDVALDCSEWREGGEATARAADGSDFEAVRLGYNDSLAVIWDTGDKRYQLMFGDVAFAERVTASAEFRNAATGAAYGAEITVDCAG